MRVLEISALLMDEDSLLVELLKEKKYDNQLGDFNEEILFENEVIHDTPSRIGTFVCTKDDVYTVSIPYEEGNFVESQIIPKVALSCEKEIVTYDARLKRTIVICFIYA